ncbi:MAG: polymer-forming cytoskeletal protein [Alphaproteobacteria bacterium]|jgi:cytoskeletal protein CcmA (bactofilin family)|nr:polymer-forming cytoskeletal protein [Alphaproteobacteria bacterium]
MLGIKKDFYTTSLINMKTEITGNIKSEGEIVINGLINGNITGNEIHIGKSGMVKGKIIGEKIIVEGRCEGNIEAKSILLKPSAKIFGDVYHDKISIETGAQINGKLREKKFLSQEKKTKTTTKSKAKK